MLGALHDNSLKPLAAESLKKFPSVCVCVCVCVNRKRSSRLVDVHKENYKDELTVPLAESFSLLKTDPTRCTGRCGLSALAPTLRLKQCSCVIFGPGSQAVRYLFTVHISLPHDTHSFTL